MTRMLNFTSIAVLAVTAIACQAPPPPSAPDTRAADQAAIEKADQDWAHAATVAKDVDKTVSFYSDDALVMPPNAAMPMTKAAIRQVWKEYIESPDFAGGWKATRTEVARSGDLGYASGTWSFTWKDANGKPIEDHGNFGEVWKKQSDGSWKCVSDVWNSVLPLPAPDVVKK